MRIAENVKRANTLVASLQVVCGGRGSARPFSMVKGVDLELERDLSHATRPELPRGACLVVRI